LRRLDDSIEGSIGVVAVDIVEPSHTRASNCIDIDELSDSAKALERDGDQKFPQNELGVSRLDSTRDAGENESFGVVIWVDRLEGPAVHCEIASDAMAGVKGGMGKADLADADAKAARI